MSKEFEVWWENTAVSGNRKKAMDAAFTAGRALGRREVKGEAKTMCKTGRASDSDYWEGYTDASKDIAGAIEAIPEEVQGE